MSDPKKGLEACAHTPGSQYAQIEAAPIEYRESRAKAERRNESSWHNFYEGDDINDSDEDFSLWGDDAASGAGSSRQYGDPGYSTGSSGEKPADQAGSDIAPEFSEEAMALEFARKYRDKFIFVEKLGDWFSWDGCKWRAGQRLRTQNAIRQICRSTAKAVNAPSLRRRIASYRTVDAVERLARTEMAAPADQWDRDVWSLNTPAGVINLCDGRIREALPTDFMTKSTSVAPGGTCPRFLQFIHEIFDGNEELVTFFQRVFGLCLTGVTRDHAVFFGYGSGGNGKSLLMRIMGEILGDYHAVSSVEAFSVSKHDRHLTEIARLRGARLVIVSETESGRQWAEARVKELTGGTPVAANFMRQDQFEFVPQFKLFVTGNNKPNLAAATESMRRRFNLIPFNVTFSGPRRDNLLYDKLVEELPGILAWAIEGCAQWQLCGLMPPAAVSEATDEYFLSQDIFGVWLSTMCEQHPLCGESARSLFASYKAFCKLQVGETPHGEKQFAQELARRGFAKKRTNSGIVYVGIRLAEQHAETPGGLCQNETDGGGDVC